MITIIGVLSVVVGAGFNDSLEQFPIGFWNYAPIEVFDEAKIQEWQDAGITLTMGPEYQATPENVAHMRKVLDWAQARKIKVIICDPRTRAHAAKSPDFADGVKKAVKELGDHPAAFGFHILDEPSKEDFEPTCQAVQTVKEAAPRLHPFVNLLPWFPGADAQMGYDDWGKYLDDFLKKSGAEFLCYDCYIQINPETSGWPSYFRNLREYGAAARRNGVPFWNTILSVGHFHYKCPNEDDIRWQFNTSVAYGAQGILYFFFYMRQPHDNYRLAPIDEFWDRTPAFESLKRTNKGFAKRYGRLFLDLQLQKAMQWPEPIAGCDPFEPDDLIKDVSADGKRPIIVSRFADKQSRPWVAVVNNSTDESTQAVLTFAGADTKVFMMNWENQEGGVGTEKAEGAVMVRHWLAPGQMEVYRVEPVK